MTDAIVGSHRRWWPMKFSLRTMLIVICGISIWLSFMISAVHRQKTAVAALHKAGVAVHYDYQFDVLTTSDLTYPEGHHSRTFYPNQFSNRIAVPATPDWLRQMIGDDYFQSVAAASIYDKISVQLSADEHRIYLDELIPHLHQLPDLQAIFIHAPRDRYDRPIFTAAKERLEREFPQADVTEIGFLSIR